MKDFYTLLKVPSNASEDAIGNALASVSPDLRAEAQFILLDPRRRAVYDRNHHLLSTIGELRSHLGLSYTRFWARQEYKDFWRDLVANPVKPGRQVDATLIASAFTAGGRHGSTHVMRRRKWLVLVVAIALLLLAMLVWSVAR